MKSQNKPFAFRGVKFFGIVCSAYLILLLINHQQALASLIKAGSILAKVIPVFMVVILFTSLLNYLLKPKKITKHLGTESGFKGWFWAIIAGVISHGPMYTWYPFFEELLEHKIKKGLIVTFFAARTIKLPMLPMMADYFGLTFTAVLMVYILIFSLLQGWIYTILTKSS